LEDEISIQKSVETRGDEDGLGRDRYSLYRNHIFAAQHFSESARDLEDRGAGEIGQDGVWRHRAYVTAAILSAAAFLEASINELYFELEDAGHPEWPRIPRRALALLRPDIEHSPVLHKYQVVLLLADAERFNESRPPFRDADTLLKLREALVHFKSDGDDRRGKYQKLEQRLRAKFPPNPLASQAADWFPDLCLGAGCAEWAVRAASEFSDAFCSRMSIPSRGPAWRDVGGTEAPEPAAPRSKSSLLRGNTRADESRHRA
jgi:hypothetical protein